MSVTRAWIIYSLVRLAAFAVPFVLVMLILPTWQWSWAAGALVGALVSWAISQLALTTPRTVIAQSLADRKAAAETRDPRHAIDLEEDADLDAQETESPRTDSDI